MAVAQPVLQGSLAPAVRQGRLHRPGTGPARARIGRILARLPPECGGRHLPGRVRHQHQPEGSVAPPTGPSPWSAFWPTARSAHAHWSTPPSRPMPAAKRP